MSGFLAVERRQIRRGSAALAAALEGLWRHRELPANASRAECARWLHESCARAMRVIELRVEISGTLPQHGMIVSNHLSYLDIPTFSAALPCVFVSKAEVEQWPLIGRYARWAGSVFVHRHDRSDAARANVSVADALHNGVPVVLFPEGTTTDGQRVLRFHPTMLQPAIDAAAPLTPCAIRYELEDGDPALEVCWWGTMTLLPHIWNLLGKKVIRARIVFGEPVLAAGDRKQLGARLHESVLGLYQGLMSGAAVRLSPPG
ncbi:MAG TPA: lysophospholipid acyltransferase family protein [Bryocella sp.]|nr:lysophospholipid acyltransferase family protein [Bryocella sp.]